jgi:hypothetical protein
MSDQLYYVYWKLPGQANHGAQRSAIALPCDEAERLVAEKNGNTPFLAWSEPVQAWTAEEILRREG